MPLNGGACSSVLGVADAVGGGAGRVTFVSTETVTWTATITAAPGSSGNWVCWCATAGGTYQSVTDGTVVAILAVTEPPALLAISTAALMQGASAATLTLIAAALVNNGEFCFFELSLSVTQAYKSTE